MKILTLLFVVSQLLAPATASAQKSASTRALPACVFSGWQEGFHCQGIAYDSKRDCLYLSFTTSLIRLSMDGKVLGSVKGITGHLGCLSLNPDNGLLYASLEYKHDVIGKGITDATKADNDDETGFYIAIFDVDKVTAEGMDASEVMKTVYIREAVNDYLDSVQVDGRTLPHRHACSGIDGITFAPKWGKANGRNMLYVAYGIYGDVDRTDNERQVILCYDVKRWEKYATTLSAQNLHRNGPPRPLHKYFADTGNTDWGIQNLCYDAGNRRMLAATYRSRKSGSPGFTLFALDHGSKPHSDTVPLCQLGETAGNGTRGWHFPYGSTGITYIGGGLFYISEPRRENGKESTTVRLYRWTGDNEAFVRF